MRNGFVGVPSFLSRSSPGSGMPGGGGAKTGGSRNRLENESTWEKSTVQNIHLEHTGIFEVLALQVRHDRNAAVMNRKRDTIEELSLFSV